MHVDMTGNLVVVMPDIDGKCPECETSLTIDGESFEKIFNEPLASAEVKCENCGNDFYVHVEN